MNINVLLDEVLTTNNSVILIVELLKYILYQTQQIPFTCDSLNQLQMKSTDKNLSSVKTLLHALKSMSEHLNLEFHLEGCKVKEISILVGATIISPKLHIRVELPPDMLSSQEHFDCKHNARKALLSLMRSMLECTQFQKALCSLLNPTNTFMFLHKSDNSSTSDFFLPKPQYTPPECIKNYFIIKLQHNDQIRTHCNCVDIVKVYNDISESKSNKVKDICIFEQKEDFTNIPYRWYQSKEVIKGFRFTR